MAVEHGLPLFLDLPPPALLGMLHFVQHVGSGVGMGQDIVSVGKRLLVLETQIGKRHDKLKGMTWVSRLVYISGLLTK